MSQLVAKNAFILTFVEVFSKAIEFVSFVVLARILGAEKYGLMNFVYTIGTMFVLIPHFGFDQLVARDVAREKEHAGAYLVGISAAKILLFAVTITIMAIWLNVFSGFNADKKWLLYIGFGGIFFLSNIFFTAAFFRAYQKAYLEAIIRIILAVLVMAVSIGTVLISSNLFDLFIMRLVVAGMASLLSVSLVLKVLKPDIRSAFKNLKVWPYLRMGWPFAVYILFIVVYVSIGVVMLNMMAGDKATGLYSVAAKILTFFLIIPTGISNAVMPAMSARIKSDPEGFHQLSDAVVRLVLIIGILGVMFNVLLGPKIISLLFGEEYLLSGAILSLMSWSLIATYLNHVGNTICLAFNREKAIVVFTAMGAAFNIALNLFLIPRYSFFGAAVSLVLTETLIAILQYGYLRIVVFPQFSAVRNNIMVLVSGVAMIVLMKLALPTQVLLGFSFAIVGYLLFLFKFKYLDRQQFISFSKYLMAKQAA